MVYVIQINDKLLKRPSLHVFLYPIFAAPFWGMGGYWRTHGHPLGSGGNVPRPQAAQSTGSSWSWNPFASIPDLPTEEEMDIGTQWYCTRDGEVTVDDGDYNREILQLSGVARYPFMLGDQGAGYQDRVGDVKWKCFRIW